MNGRTALKTNKLLFLDIGTAAAAAANVTIHTYLGSYAHTYLHACMHTQRNIINELISNGSLSGRQGRTPLFPRGTAEMRIAILFAPVVVGLEAEKKTKRKILGKKMERITMTMMRGITYYVSRKGSYVSGGFDMVLCSSVLVCLLVFCLDLRC